MGEIFVACDLDNTLIHSKKNRRPDDCCIEEIAQAESSFMSGKTIELLQYVVAHSLFVPVTTRSKEQYLRIRWPEGCQPHYALTNNGAILLEDNRENISWREQSLANASQYVPQLKTLCREMSDSGRFKHCNIIEGMYIYACCEDGVDSASYLTEFNRKTALKLFASGKKMYAFPPLIEKRTAIERFKEFNFPIDIMIAAGDDAIDINMLNAADIALVPNEQMAKSVSAKSVLVCGEDELFSEFLLKKIIEKT